MAVNIGDLLASLPDNLTREAKEGLIRSTLPRFLEEGYSGSQALGIYREAGLGIREQDFYSIRREILGLEERTQRIRFVGGSNIPSDSVYAETDKPLQTQYRHIIRLSYTENTNLRSVPRYMNYDTNFRYTIDQIETDALEDFKSRYPQLADTVNSTRIWKGFKRSG